MAMINIKRKGMFFSLLSVVLVILFIAVFRGSSIEMNHYNEETSIQESRYVNSYVDDLKNNLLHRILSEATKKSLEAMLDYVNDTNYVDSSTVRFNELMINGTIYGDPRPEMVNMTLYNWTNKIKRISIDELGIETNITHSRIMINHSSPWEILVSYDVNMTIKKDDILYTIKERISENVSIEGYYEPMSLRYSKLNGVDAKRTIYKTNRTFVDTNPTQKKESVIMLMNSSDFRNVGNRSPDFLMRLEGKITGSPQDNGIQALINETFIFNKYGGAVNRSSIDYFFYNSTKTFNQPCDAGTKLVVWDDYNSIDEMAYFRVSELDINLYNTTGTWDDVCS